MMIEEEMVFSLKQVVILYLINIRGRNPVRDDSILILPDTLLIDYYLELSKQNKTEDLVKELKDFSTFIRLLKNYSKGRSELYHIYFTVTRTNNADFDHSIIKDYLHDFKVNVQRRNRNDDSVIALGYKIGCFLNEIAMFRDSCDFLNVVMDLCLQSNDYEAALSCCIKLLHSQISFGSMKKAFQSYNLTQFLLQKLKYRFHNLVECHAVYTNYFFSLGNYTQAVNYAVKALHAISPFMDVGSVVDLLNYASKACARKGFFAMANKLCRFCSILLEGCCGEWSRFYIETLLTQAKFRGSIKLYEDTVTLYNTSLNYSRRVFGECGFYTGYCYSELSYAQYVKDYVMQRFDDANEYADKARDIMRLHAEPDNLHFAYCERSKAVIIEEISTLFRPVLEESLRSAEKIHLKMLKVTMETFGEYSYHVAKVYAVLGRLYQTLNMFTISEKMQLNSIRLKESLLHPDDYEVALSSNYLGSLYFSLQKYRNAETQYKSAMEILVNIYGKFTPMIKVNLSSLVAIFGELGFGHYRSIYLRKLDEVILKEEETIRNLRVVYPESPVTFQDVIEECRKSLW